MIGVLIGVVAAVPFAVAALIVGRRPIHACGALYDATIEIDRPLSLLHSCVLGAVGTHRGEARFSRGLGGSTARRDFHGFALRIDDADGRGGVQDLILLNARLGEKREKMLRVVGYGQRYSSIAPSAVGGVRMTWQVAANRPLPATEELEAGAAVGARFGLSVRPTGGLFEPVGTVTIGSLRPADAQRRSHYSPWNWAGGIEPVGFVNDMRREVYRATQWCRQLRGG